MANLYRDFCNFLKAPEGMELTDDGFPILKPLHIKRSKPFEMIGFNEFYRAKNKEDKVVHFYLADYLIERAWTRLNDTTDLLMPAKAVLTPDFSLFIDMPEPMLRWNKYRSLFIGAYWQRKGIKVIPTAQWAGEETFDWCFKGLPLGGAVSVSSVGIMRKKEASRLFKAGYEELLKQVKPSKVLWYGKVPEWLDTENVLIHAAQYEERFSKEDME